MPHALRYSSLLIVLHAFVVPVRSDEARPRPTTRNVVLVTTDGLRWQEVFRGADDSLLNKKDGGVADPDALRRAFWRETPEARREALLPFLWSTVARQGQVFGNRDKKSLAHVTNGKNFSYPGYNELFTGSADPRIDSNAKRPNPNVSVLEWLHRKPAFRGEVAAVASWDLFPFILNVERSGLTVNAGWMPLGGPSLTESQALLNRLMSRSVRDWENSRNDVLTFQVALEHLRRDTPRVFYVGFGDTDEYAHGGRYDQYLRAAHDADAEPQDALGRAPGAPAVPRHDHADRDHRPRPRRPAAGLAEPRREGRGLGGDLARRPRPRHPRTRRAVRDRDRDPGPGGRHARRPARGGLQRRGAPGRPPDRGRRQAPGRWHRRLARPAAPPDRLRLLRLPGPAPADLGRGRGHPARAAPDARRQHLRRHRGHGRDARQVRQARRRARASRPSASRCRSSPPGTTTTSASTTAAATTPRRSSRRRSSSTSSATPRTRRAASGPASTTRGCSAPRGSGSRSSCSTPATSGAARSRRRPP